MGDIGSVATLISTVGFPIVCCVAMALYVKYITDKNREEVAELNREHKVEMSEVTTAITNNTLAMQQLADIINIKLGGDGHVKTGIVSDRDS